MNLILIRDGELRADDTAVLTDERARHILSVLKCSEGDCIRVGLLNGPMGEAQITSTARGVTLRCQFSDNTTPELPRIDLLLALPRPKVMMRLWAQLAALGVGHIAITNAHRVERFYFDSRACDPEIYTERLIEGLQQAKDTRLPTVSFHKQFKIMVEDDLNDLFPQAKRLLLHPDTERKLSDLNTEADQRIVLAIGPEGGWQDFEIDLLRSRDFTPVSLGGRTLRTDTACIAAVSLAHHVVA